MSDKKAIAKNLYAETLKLLDQGKKLYLLQYEYKNVILEQGKNSTEAREFAGEIKSLNSDIN